MRKLANKGRMGKTDYVSGAVIVLAVFLILLLSWIGSLKTENDLRAAAHDAAQTVAGVQSREEYVQLSDPLLVVVNDWTPLPKAWRVTPRMIDDEQVDVKMYDDLAAMTAAAAKEDVWLWVVSGYRSVEQQEAVLERAIRENVKSGMMEIEAEEDALRTVARPGCSEHHTGLAVDFNDVTDDFEASAAYEWLAKHAAEYGFIQRYRKEKAELTGIDRESWHYRYVGKTHAREMERLDFCLEEYVEYLKKQGVR